MPCSKAKFTIKPRSYIPETGESRGSLQCNRCGRFDKPTRFQIDHKRVYEEKDGKPSHVLRAIRRDYCLDCSGSGKQSNPTRARRLTYQEMENRISDLEREQKEIKDVVEYIIDYMKAFSSQNREESESLVSG